MPHTQVHSVCPNRQRERRVKNTQEVLARAIHALGVLALEHAMDLARIRPAMDRSRLMLSRTVPALAVSAALLGGARLTGQPVIRNRHVAVSLQRRGSEVHGLEFRTASGRMITALELCNGSRWTARGVVNDGSGRVTLSGFSTAGSGGTPELGPGSRVRVTLLPDSPYPRIDFRFEIRSFDAEAWTAALKPDAPLYFLRSSLPGTTFHYQGGGLIPDPAVEAYPLSMKGFMAGEWSDGWSYAPALSAWAVPAAGLWNHKQGVFVGYDFNHARHTDRSCKALATAYCAGNGDHTGPSMCLVYPYQRKWTQLTFPESPSTVESHFDLIYSFDLPSSADPNMFVLQRLFSELRGLLPPVPRMNDLSWIHREDQWTPPVGLPRTQAGSGLVAKSGSSGLEGAFLELGTTMLGNSFISDGLRHDLNTGNEAALAKLKTDLDFLMREAVWFEVDGEPCVSWRLPLAGEFQDRWGGKRAEGIYHCKTWQAGTAFLLLYEVEKNPEYLRFVDAVYNWTKHFVFTRNGVCDLPWAMFCRVGTAAGENFLLNYRRVFRTDSVRGRNRDEALRLAHMCLYKVTWFYTADPDETDELDPTFLNQAVNDASWAGRVTWNECGWVLRSMVPLYCETGDPFFKYLLRGAMERYWIGFRDDGGIAENLQISGEIEPKGLRTGGFADMVHGANVRRYALPVGDARLRVAVGERAAIGFCKGDRAFDVADYRYEPEGNFRFRLVALRPDSGPASVNLIASAPFRDIRGKQVLVNGRPVAGVELNAATNGEDVYVPGVRPGDVVQVGELRETAPFPVEELPWREPPSASAMVRDGFVCLDLSSAANAAIERAWGEPWFGYVPGWHVRHGVPFHLVDPELNGGLCAVDPAPQAAIALPDDIRTTHLYLFFGGPRDGGSGGEPLATVELRYADGTNATVRAERELLADVTGFMPLRDWDLYMSQHNGAPGRAIRDLMVRGGRLLAVTMATENTPPDRVTIPEQAVAAARAERAAERAMAKRLAHGRALCLSARYSGANDYAHVYVAVVDSGELLTIPPSSFLEYDLFLPLDSAGFSAGVDLLGGSLGDLRDKHTSDRHGPAHPSNMVKAAKGRWAHRRIGLAELAGRTFGQAVLASDGLVHMPGPFRAFFKDVHLTDGAGTTLVPLYLNDAELPIEKPAAMIERAMEDWRVEIVPVADVRNPQLPPRPAPESPDDILNLDPSFEEQGRYWQFGGQTEAWTSDTAHSGRVCADLSIPDGGLALLTTNFAGSMHLGVAPDTVYRVSFWANAPPPGATLRANFYDGRGYDFDQITVEIEGDGNWHRYDVAVPTRAFPKEKTPGRIFRTAPHVLPAFRLWAMDKAQTVFVDDVHVRRSTRPPAPDE